MMSEPGSVFAKVHDVPESIDPETGTTMQAAVEMEIDVVIGTTVHCITTYVPPSYTFIEIRDVLQRTTRTLALSLGFSPDTPVKIIEYRHTQEVPQPT